MIKTNVVVGLLTLALFSTAQYQGWNLFQTSPLFNGGARTYHK